MARARERSGKLRLPERNRRNAFHSPGTAQARRVSWEFAPALKLPEDIYVKAAQAGRFWVG